MTITKEQTRIPATVDNSFNKLVNDHLTKLPKQGEIIQAQVLQATKKEILVDIDGFTTGVIRGHEMKNLPLEFNKITPGDRVDVLVLDLENENGQMELSLKAALIEGAWDYIKDKEKNQEVIEVKINGANKGGLLTSIKGIQAFLPVSQLTPEHYPRVDGGDKKKILKKLKSFVGTNMTVKIINSDAQEEKIIISEKRAWEETQKKKLSEYSLGTLVNAKIKAITNFGVFVEFDDSLEGLVHISEIPSAPSKKMSELYEVGTEVEAKIIDIKGSKVFLSLKR